MRFHGLDRDDVYRVYGIAEHEGAVAIVRPDGYVGTIVHLEDVEQVSAFLQRCLITVAM